MRIDWTTMLAACILTFILGLGGGMFGPAIFDCRAGGANALCPSDDWAGRKGVGERTVEDDQGHAIGSAEGGPPAGALQSTG